MKVDLNYRWTFVRKAASYVLPIKKCKRSKTVTVITDAGYLNCGYLTTIDGVLMGTNCTIMGDATAFI